MFRVEENGYLITMRRESDGLLTFDGFPFSMEQKPGRDEKFTGRDKTKDRSDANRV